MRKNWIDNLSLEDRLQVQKFMIKLYAMDELREKE